MIYIQNPEMDLSVAPKGKEYHCSFNHIDSNKYIIISAQNIYDLNELYLNIKNKLESVEFNNFENELIKLKNNLNGFEYYGKNNYFINSLENFENKNLIIAVFCCFEFNEEIFELDKLKEVKKIKLSEYSYKKIKTHKQEAILTGNIHTNNKLTEFFWNIDNKELFDKIYYEVSLWKDNKLIKIYETSNDSFVFAEHALDQNDGEFELIVVAKDSYDSSSVPASYIFNLKTEIADDFKIVMENEYEEEVNVTSLNSPKFKIYPFEEGYDYKIYLANETFSYKESLEQGKEYFKIDNSKNCLYFYCPLILEDNRYLLNIEKIDDVGNKTGNYINPMGKYGRTFFSFIISNIVPEKPELIDFYWLSNTRCFINFKSDEKTKSFKIYQNNFLMTETVESFCEISPVFEQGKDLIIKVYTVNYMGMLSDFALEINIKKYIDFIDDINISKDDFEFKDDEYFTNNPKPLFKWDISDIKNLKYYAISLDGSNWTKIKDNRFIFKKPLKDNKYKFRIKAINLDGIEGQINTFDFKLQTKNLSAPLFTRETLTLKPNTVNNIKLSWLPVTNIKKYQFVFNTSLIEENENIFETNEDFILCENYKQYLSTGINKIMIRTVDLFNNKSKWNALNFIITNEDKIIQEDILSLSINQSSPLDGFYTFSIPELLGYPFKKLFLISPEGIDIEIIDEFEGNEWTNAKEFDQDGVWQLEVQYFKKSDDKQIFSNKINYIDHIFNSYHYLTNNLRIDNNIIKWDSETNNKYNYYEYSICLKDFNYLNFNKTYSNEINIKNKFIAGKYKLMLRTYSLNNILCEEHELFFEINDIYNLIEEEILLKEIKLKIKKFNNKRIFYINKITNLKNEEIQGILLYKEIKEQYFNIYNKENFLNLNTNYNFLFNEVITNE